jgi:dTDP-4-dehydrorhamnose 3,5-epimerase
MQGTRTDIPDVVLFEAKVFSDGRGFFFESFNAREFERDVGLLPQFVQDNISRSARGVIRGLHYQVKNSQGKLVRTIAGEIYDVAVDLRRSSPTFGRAFSTVLSAHNKRMLWIPPGFAHGFLAVSEQAEVLYKTTDYWAPQHERTVLWNDPDLAISWPVDSSPIVSDKDAAGTRLRDAELYD